MKRDATLTRRGMVRRMGLAGAFAALGTPLAARAAAPRKKADAFALVGDRYHNSDYIRTGLGKTLVREAGLSIDFTDEVTMLSAEALRGRRMLIVFRDGMLWPEGYIGSYPGYEPSAAKKIESEPPLPSIEGQPVMWIQPEQGRAVKEFVRNGGSALFYHNVSHVSLGNRDFRDVEGAGYNGHPAVRPFWLRITDTGHPITRGVRDFLVTDEQHYVIYDKGPEKCLHAERKRRGAGLRGQGRFLRGGLGVRVWQGEGLLPRAGAHDLRSLEPGVCQAPEECGTVAAAGNLIPEMKEPLCRMHGRGVP